MFAIRAPRLFDGDAFTGDGVTVLVDDGRIAGVEPGFPDVGERWEVVEFEDATVLPGLIDTHVHLVTDSADGALDRVAGYSEQGAGRRDVRWFTAAPGGGRDDGAGPG